MKNKKKIIIIAVILTIITVTSIMVIVNTNNWKKKFEIRDIQSSGLLDDNGTASMTGKIKNTSDTEYSNVYVVVKYYTKVNPKSKIKYYIDKCYVGDLTLGEEKEWKSSISKEQRENLVMYNKKIEKVEYKIK